MILACRFPSLYKSEVMEAIYMNFIEYFNETILNANDINIESHENLYLRRSVFDKTLSKNLIQKCMEKLVYSRIKNEDLNELNKQLIHKLISLINFIVDLKLELAVKDIVFKSIEKHYSKNLSHHNSKDFCEQINKKVCNYSHKMNPTNARLKYYHTKLTNKVNNDEDKKLNCFIVNLIKEFYNHRLDLSLQSEILKLIIRLFTIRSEMYRIIGDSVFLKTKSELNCYEEIKDLFYSFIKCYNIIDQGCSGSKDYAEFEENLSDMNDIIQSIINYPESDESFKDESTCSLIYVKHRILFSFKVHEMILNFIQHNKLRIAKTDAKFSDCRRMILTIFDSMSELLCLMAKSSSTLK